jgi:DNA-3-methyladenine glycosylase
MGPPRSSARQRQAAPLKIKIGAPPNILKRLPRDFYNRDTQLVAKELLGKFLVHRAGGLEKIGKIVEVEAYLGPHDLASHSSRGLTERTRVMFGPPGYVYVYMIYGMYNCVNVVTEAEGHASAVLIRALEPIKNINQSTRGPGLLCKALGIDKKLNGHDLWSNDLFIAESAAPEEKFTLVKKPRIGVDYAKHWSKRLLRFYIKNNLHVSKM